MCVATAALIVGGIGAAVSTVGVIGAGNARAEAGRYQAQVARNNAIIAEQNAQRATQEGNVAAETQGAKNRAMLARTKVGQAASGVDVNSGSAADVRAGNAEAGMQDVLTIKNNALLRSYGYRAQKENFTSQAGLDEMQADNAQTAGYMEGAGTLLGGASSLGFKWSGVQNPSGVTKAAADSTVWNPKVY